MRTPGNTLEVTQTLLLLGMIVRNLLISVETVARPPGKYNDEYYRKRDEVGVLLIQVQNVPLS